MKKTAVLVLLFLLVPAYPVSAYTVYLNNGSVITGVSSYAEQGEKVIINFDAGSVTILKGDIARIEGKELTGKITGVDEEPEKLQQRETDERTGTSYQRPQSVDEKSAKKNTLLNKLDSVINDIKAVNEEESKLVAEINERQGKSSIYNIIQLKQMEKDLEPLWRNLRDVQQKKSELVQRRYDIEAELNSLQ
ncbi:MAG: hypothetical protein AB1552_08100 [Nitrospirota bacterium]